MLVESFPLATAASWRFEVKLSAAIGDRDVAHLRWPADRAGPGLLDAAVITTGAEAYRRRDGIAVIPAALLSA